MPIIYSYPKTQPQSGDLLIISRLPDDPDETSTFNISIDALAEYIGTYVIDPAGTDFSIPVFNQGGKRITSSIISQDSSPSNGVVGTKITISGKLDVGDTTIIGTFNTNSNATLGQNNTVTTTVKSRLSIQGPVIDSASVQGTGEQVLVSQTDGTVKWENYQGSGLEYQVAWNASTDTPDLTAIVLDSSQTGKYWVVSVAGNTPLPGASGGNITDWQPGDWAIISEDISGNVFWDKIDNTSVLTGTGTNNTLTKWTGPTTLGDSIVSESVTGINVTGTQSSFAGQLTIATTPVAATDAASKAYVDAHGVTSTSSSTNDNLLGIKVTPTTGAVTIGLDIDSLVASTLPQADEIYIPYYDEANDVNRRVAYSDLSLSSGSIKGSGTLNTIAMFTPDGTTIGNSTITLDSAGAVNENVTSSSKVFQIGTGVTGDFAQLNLLSPGSSGIINTSGSGNLILRTNSSSTAQLVLDDTGSLQAKSYGSGTFTGTATYALSVDSTGNIIETTAGGGGSVTGDGNQYNIPVWSDTTELSGLTASTGLPSSDSLTAGITTQYIDLGAQGPGSVPTQHTIKNYNASGSNASTYLFNQSGIFTVSGDNGGRIDVGVNPANISSSALNVGTGVATFKGGVIISNSPGGVQVDNSSLVVGSGTNDNISGSDHCLIVGSGNQITSNSDQSVAFGQGNAITSSVDAFAVGNSNTLTSSLRTQALGFNNTITASSSFVAGGGNSINANANVFALGDGHTVTTTGSTEDAYLIGTGNTITGGTGSFVIGSNLDGDTGNHMVIGYRNNKTSYPATNYSLGLGNTKFALSVGSTTTTNSNALLITEGGVNRGGGVAQIPRVLLPTIVSFNYANDTAAAAAGIPVGGLYHNAGVLRIRLT